MKENLYRPQAADARSAHNTEAKLMDAAKFTHEEMDHARQRGDVVVMMNELSLLYIVTIELYLLWP